jgi:23S rRNA (adenine1618-N6)-methyltransferase
VRRTEQKDTKEAKAKPGLHPRNRHREGYDFAVLVKAEPGLRRFLAVNAFGNRSIDFADPAAVKALNRALLKSAYGIEGWDIPEGYLCPPIPGRADYLHHLADLLASEAPALPRGASVRVLDLGTGANLVYPLLGHREYGWRFLGSDIDAKALASAEAILHANSGLEKVIALRRQQAPRILEGLLKPGETFELSMCNPPFFASAAEAREATVKKRRNLGQGGAATRNFGGQGAELWCPGGEAAFLKRMIAESKGLADRALWFTSLVSKSATLPAVRAALAQSGAVEQRTVAMAQGQKQSRFVAWTFLDAAARRAWLTRVPDMV